MHLGCRQLEVGTWAKNLAGGRPSRAGGVRKRNPQNEERGQSPELCASSCLVISVSGIPTALGTQDSWPPSLHSGQQTGAPCGEDPEVTGVHPVVGCGGPVGGGGAWGFACHALGLARAGVSHALGLTRAGVSGCSGGLCSPSLAPRAPGWGLSDA